MNDHVLPPKGWCDEDGLTVKEFRVRLDEFRQRKYSHDDVEYTHDIYYGQTIIGQAACVEEMGGLTLGMFSIAGLEPSYGTLGDRLALVPKEYRQPPKK